MAQRFTVSLAQIEIAALDPEGNRAKILEIAEVEARAGSRLIVFPELATTGYVEPMMPGAPVGLGLSNFPDYATRLQEIGETLEGPTVSGLTAIAKQHGACIVVGMALRDPAVAGQMSNASVLVAAAGPLAVYHKVHLWQNEKLLFAPGREFAVTPTPMGKIGMQICYDIRFPEATRALALGGAEIVTSIWASFRPDEETESKLKLELELDPAQFRHRAYMRAQENGVFFVSCNRVGQQSGYQFMGHSVVAAPDGRILAAADCEDEEILRAEIDLGEITRYRSFVNLLNDRRPELYEAVTRPL